MRIINFVKKNEKNIYTAACIVLFLFSSLALIKSVSSHYRFISYPYQLEYREGGALNITKLFLEDRNPFSIEEQPQNTYVYGFIYPLAVTPVTRIFGNTLFVHRSFVYFFILMTCLLVFYVLVRMKINYAFAFAAIVILHQSIINAPNTAVARPEGLGIFLFTLGMIIPRRWKYSNISLAVSTALAVMAYLTKPYYVLIIPILAAYLFIFISKKKGIIYFAISCLFLITSVWITTLVFPVYLNNTLVHHIKDSVYYYNYMKDQVAVYAETNIFLLLLIFLSCVLIFRNFLKKHFTETVSHLIEYSKSLFQPNFNLKIFKDEPLIKSRFDLLFAFTFLFILILFIAKLGGHIGNNYAAYLFQLASPFFIIITFQLLEKTSNKIYMTFATVLLIITMNNEFVTPKYDFDRFTNCFKQMEELIRENKNVLNSPENVSIILDENMPVYNSGLSEYFPGKKNKSHILGDASDEVTERTEIFQKEMDEKIKAKEFDLILLTKGRYIFFVNPDLLNQNYKLTGTLCAPFINQEAVVETWEPK